MTASMQRATGFIGAGVTGATLARALSAAGIPVTAAASRSRASAERLAAAVPGCRVVASGQDVAERADLVFLTVPDDVLAEVAGAIAWRPGQAVVHCSGAQPVSLLAPAERQGAAIGGFHPLQTLPDMDQPPSVLRGVAFGVEAEAPLRGELEGLARDLGGWPIPLSSSDRALYHASAVAVCGFVATLLGLASELWHGMAASGGETRDESGNGVDVGLQALLPLVRGTVESVAERGLPGALTGPLVRGDAGTVRRHLEALERVSPGFMHLYGHLALAALPMARAKGGLDPSREAEIERLLRGALEPVGVS